MLTESDSANSSSEHNQNVIVELSRRINRNPSFPFLQLLNHTCNYFPVEVLDRYDNGDIGFRFIYLDGNDFRELDESLKAKRNLTCCVYLELVLVNSLLKRYKLKNSHITQYLCNYSLVTN